jgi:tetratricopeptide (TPR) repeat protein
MYWFAMSMFALAQGDYQKCISMSEECLMREPDNVDALYNKGISLLNLALNEKKSDKRRNLYKRALEPMEKVRELSPDAINRWGNPLYRIYLNLNMGSKFEEMDHLLEKHQIEERRSHNSQIIGNKLGKGDSNNMDKHLGNP